MRLNILIEGQSNAQAFYAGGFAVRLAATVQRLLGFDGVRDHVAVLGGDGVSVVSGTPFLPGGLASPSRPAWLNATGIPAHPWRDGPGQAALDRALAALPPEQRDAATAIVWLHNESDGFNAQITPVEWSGGLAHALAETRAALGQDAATTPAFFVLAPVESEPSPLGPLLQGSVAQNIRLGFQALIDDPDQHAAWGAQAGDSDMNGSGPFFGGLHMSAGDLRQLTERLALAIADQFAGHATPGAPVANGGLDWTGPAAVAAQLLADQSNQILVRLSEPADGGMLRPLSPAAAAGAGWSVQDGASALYASAAELRSGGMLLLTFPAPVPSSATARLYYGYGSGRIAAADHLLPPGPEQAASHGAAIYDAAGLPLQATAEGLALGQDGPAGAPAVSGDASATIAGTAQLAQVALGGGIYTVQAGAGAAMVDNGVGAATVFGGAGPLTVRGGAGAIVVTGGTGALFASGGLRGHERLSGGEGDAVLAGSVHDTLVGGGGATFALFAGDGVFFGGSGDATVAAGAGVLLAVTGIGADLIFGSSDSAASTAVYGGQGSTTLVGGHGHDVFTGGAGAAAVWAGAGQTSVMGGGGELAAYGNAAPEATLFVAQGHGPASVVGGAGTALVYGSTDPAATLSVQGSDGASTVTGGAGALAVWAAAGSTLVFAGPGGGVIQGGAGALEVVTDASSGPATVAAGGGNLTLFGGGGKPLDITLAEGSAGGVYQFSGLRPGIDTMRLTGYAADAAHAAIASATELGGNGVEIVLADKSRIVLFGMDRAHAAALVSF